MKAKKASQSKKKPKVCKGCGKPEEKTALGYTNIAPHLGYCTDCLVAAAKELK